MRWSRRWVRTSTSAKPKPRQMTRHRRNSKAHGLPSVGFCFLLALLAGFTTSTNSKRPDVFLLDASKLADSRQHLRPDDPALQKLTHDADAATKVGPFSV